MNLSKAYTCIGYDNKLSRVKELNKGIDILLKAMTYLDGYNLRIGGEGKEKAYYDQIVKKHGLEKKVFFYKWTNNISEFLNLADILVCPSRHEPFGNVVVDGWAHKVPVIASDTGGPGALIRNKINGLKFQNEDFFDLIEKIKFIDKTWLINLKILDRRLNRFLMEKASISINGVSLTISKVYRNSFEITVIPHTLKLTNLKSTKLLYQIF